MDKSNELSEILHDIDSRLSPVPKTMGDTSEAVRSEYYRRIAALSPTERGAILAATVHEVRQLLWAQLQHLPEFERRVAFLQRMYGRDLSTEQIRRVADVSPAAPTP